MGVFPDDLEQVYDIVSDWVKDWARGGKCKTHLRRAGTTQSGIPVILCQFWSNLLWK